MPLFTQKIWRNYPPFFNNNQESGELYTLTESLRQAIEEAGFDTDSGKKMMYLLTAEGKWIDYWGEYFKVERLENEDDETYKHRIIWEVTRPKQTLKAIQECITRYTGINESEILIFEPFTQLKPTDFGAESDTIRAYGWEYWTWAVIDIHIPLQFSFELSQKIQETTKAYGIKVVFTTHSGGIYNTADINDILSYYFSSSVVNTFQNKYGYITDFKGFTDGEFPSIHEYLTQYNGLISFSLIDYTNYGYGSGEYGNNPYGGSSFLNESTFLYSSLIDYTNYGYGHGEYGNILYGSLFFLVESTVFDEDP